MKYQLDTEEKEILNAFEWNELKSVPNVVQESVPVNERQKVRRDE